MSDPVPHRDGIAQTRKPGPTRAFVEIVAGVCLLGVGAFASFVPVVPGWLFVVPGLILLAAWFRPVRAMVSWLLGRATSMRLVSSVADNDRLRCVVSRLLASSPVRRAVDRAVRWELIHTMLVRRADRPDDAWTEPSPPGEESSPEAITHGPVLGMR